MPGRSATGWSRCSRRSESAVQLPLRSMQTDPPAPATTCGASVQPRGGFSDKPRHHGHFLGGRRPIYVQLHYEVTIHITAESIWVVAHDLEAELSVKG